MGSEAGLTDMAEQSQIPIANIYYLYCYAWERFPEGKALAVGSEQSPDLANLLAHVLLKGMKALLRRGLDRAYQPIEEQLATVRGRIELGPSLRLYARNTRRLHCEFDELSEDVLHNQILKATLLKLFALPSLEKGLAVEARRVLARLVKVSDIRLTAECFGRVRLHRNNAYYDLLINVARLLFLQLLPSAGMTGSSFREVQRDEKEMARVFEAFVRNFYRIEHSDYRVEPLTIRWDADAVGNTQIGLLPQMRVDVFLTSATREIIIDTKYYLEALQSYHGNETIRSSNLYQLYSYIKNYAPVAKSGATIDGMLLYPQVGDELEAEYQVQGHRIRVATVDLSRPWSDIHDRLVALA